MNEDIHLREQNMKAKMAKKFWTFSDREPIQNRICIKKFKINILDREGKTGANRFDDETKRGESFNSCLNTPFPFKIDRASSSHICALNS